MAESGGSAIAWGAVNDMISIAADAVSGPAVASDTRRSDIYGFLSLAFSFPDVSLHARAHDGQLVRQLSAALDQIPYRVRVSDLSWRTPNTYDEMESEYIMLFQIGGRRGPPCPLHAGHYARDRSRELQQLIRFYNFFGVRVAEGVMPDHISVQMEFMSALARGDLADSASLLRAQRDFLGRQLGWVEELAGRIRRRDPAPFYRALAAFTVRYVAADKQFLRKVLGGDYAGT
jgi:DMSO reductase family type II enzyme chaperone